MQLTLTPAQLKELVTSVAPFVERSGFYPELSGIHLRSDDGVVTSTATDRYTIGRARVEVLNAPHFEALVSHEHCAELLKLFRVPRARVEPIPVILSVSDGNLTVTQPGAVPEYTVTVPLVKSTGKALKSSDDLINKMLSAESDTAPALAYDSKLLARFSHLGSVALVRRKGSQPVLVLANNFVGLVMPQRGPRGESRSTEEFIAAEAAKWGVSSDPSEAVA